MGEHFSEEALEWAENPEWAEKYGDIDFRPPQSVADPLRWIKIGLSTVDR